MARTTTGEIKIVNAFSDDTTRTITLSPIDPTSDAFQQAKANIKALDISEIAPFYLSEDGTGSYTGIVAATTTVITENEFNLNDAE